MVSFVIRRLAAAIGVLVALVAVLFVLQWSSGLNPARVMLGSHASSEAVAALEDKLGYNDPVLTQFTRYLGRALSGDLGISVTTRGPVVDDLARYLPATMELVTVGMALALVLGFLLGISTAVFGSTLNSYRYTLIAGSATPPFLLAVILILAFGVWWGVLPTNGRSDSDIDGSGPTGLLLVDTLTHGDLVGFHDAVMHLFLPAVCVALTPAVAIGRVLRTSITRSMESGYAQTARAIGLSEAQIVKRHALRNSLNDVLAIIGLQIGMVFAGVVVIETVFGWPGLGTYASQSIPNADFPAIAGVTLIIGALYIVLNATVDVLQGVIDPRIVMADST